MLKAPIYCSRLFMFLLAALCSYNVFSQTSKAPVSSVLPVSPEAGSLGKFVDQPVSHFTGIPQIDIPMHSIKKGDIMVDVGLSYHSGGNKVDEIASRAGLGWSLNAGGVVTRSARGLPDVSGFYFDYAAYNALNYSDRANYLMNVSRGLLDSEPDIYYVNVGNLNVKIFKDNNNVWQTMPRDQSVRVQENIEGHDWIITDGNGVRYKFSSREFSSSTISSGTTDGSYNTGISSWFITQIEDTKGNTIDFIYENITYSFTTKNGEMKIVPNTGASAQCELKTVVSLGMNSVIGLRLKKISFSDGKLEFKYADNTRLDQTNDYALSRVELHNNQGLIKAYQLFTSYFVNNEVGKNMPNVYNTTDSYRLRLDSVREESVDQYSRPYRFTYLNNFGLSYRNANSQDHWGYFNGEQNYGTAVSYIEFGTRKGAKKHANAYYAKETLLSKIEYPTGGSREFEYEGNTYAGVNEIAGEEQLVQLISSYGNNVYNYNTTDNLNHYFVETFTITSEQLNSMPGGLLKLTINATTEGVDQNCSCAVNAQLKQPDNSVISIATGVTEKIEYVSQPGTYTFTGHIITEFWNNPSIYFGITISGTFPPPNVQKNLNGPGLRIKSIKHTYSPSNVQYTYFDYTDPLTGLSSGKIGNLPEYGTAYNVMSAADPNQWYPDLTCSNMSYYSSSNYQLINTKGSYIGYTNVTVSESQNGEEGRTVYKFSYENDINAETAFPFPPNSPQDWKRGLPIEESVYKKSSTGYDLVHSKRMVYEVISQSQQIAYGLKVGVSTAHQYNVGNIVAINGLSFTAYPILTDAFLLKKDTVIIKNGGLELQKSNLYNYNQDFKISQIKSSQSDGSMLEKSIFYPKDYLSNQISSPLLSRMIYRNLVSIPIEETSTVTIAGIPKLIAGTAYEYGINNLAGFEQFYLKKIYQAKTQDLFSGSRYDFLTIPTHYEEKLHTIAVNRYGQPIYRIHNGKQKQVYIWGYNHQYPIAEVWNAEYADVQTALGGLSSINNFGSQLTPSSNSVVSFLAPLRLPPFASQTSMSSLTYQPLVGMTSQTDVKGMTTYYEYDSFQRLKHIKDQNGNIVKSYCYNYAGQVTNCNP